MKWQGMFSSWQTQGKWQNLCKFGLRWPPLAPVDLKSVDGKSLAKSVDIEDL